MFPIKDVRMSAAKKTQKIKYEADPYNRLALLGVEKRDGLTKFRKVLDGRFKIGPGNTLLYRLKSPVSNDESMPHQLKIEGTWSLTPGHSLRLSVDKEGRKTFGDAVELKGEVLDVKNNSILFAVSTRTLAGSAAAYTLELAGRWQADERNRITFAVKKEYGSDDILVFTGAWAIGKDHEMVYSYKQDVSAGGKRKPLTELVFRGYWDVKDKVHVSYVLSKETGSGFDFRASAGFFRHNCIEYVLGIGVASGKRPVNRTLSLFGTWKVRDNTELTFEIKTDGGKCRSMVFGADAQIIKGTRVRFKLTKGVGEPVGAALELSKELLKGDGEAFIRFLEERGGSAILAGCAVRW